MQKIIKTILLIQCFILFVLSMGCNTSSQITAEDEPTILFAIYEALPFEEGCAVIYLDNHGDLYYDYLYEDYALILENNLFTNSKYVGHISNEEIVAKYDLFCEIPENVYCEHVDVFGAAPTEPIQFYCAVRYNEEGNEVVPLWSYDSAVGIMDNKSAKEIILWMDSWEWEMEKEGWDEETEQWYPCSDWSNLGCVRLYLEQ